MKKYVYFVSYTVPSLEQVANGEVGRSTPISSSQDIEDIEKTLGIQIGADIVLMNFQLLRKA